MSYQRSEGWCHCRCHWSPRSPPWLKCVPRSSGEETEATLPSSPCPCKVYNPKLSPRFPVSLHVLFLVIPPTQHSLGKNHVVTKCARGDHEIRVALFPMLFICDWFTLCFHFNLLTQWSTSRLLRAKLIKVQFSEVCVTTGKKSNK